MQDQQPGKGTTSPQADHVSRLLDDIGNIVDDFRKFIEEGGGTVAKEQDAAFRRTLEKVRGFVKKKIAKAEGHEARPAEEAGKAGPELAELRKVLDGFSQVLEELRKVLGSLRELVEHTLVPEAREKVRGALDRAGELTKKSLKAMEERKRAQHGEGAQAPPQGDKKEKKEEGAPQEQREQPQAQQAEQPQPEQERAQQQAPQQGPQGRPEAKAPQPPREEENRVSLFDGSDESFGAWKLLGAGSLDREGKELRLTAREDRGLAYYSARRFDDFVLRLQFRPSEDFNMTVALRFLDPEQPVPDRDNPSVSYPYDNQAYVASHTGFEVQLSPVRPASEPGTLEGVLIGDAPGLQRRAGRAEVKVNDWNELEIEAKGNHYSVKLNGTQTTEFFNSDSFRGKPAAAGDTSGYLGIVLRKGSASFRHLVAELLPAEEAKEAQPQPQPHGEREQGKEAAPGPQH